jgi:hypothetical protein
MGWTIWQGCGAASARRSNGPWIRACGGRDQRRTETHERSGDPGSRHDAGPKRRRRRTRTLRPEESHPGLDPNNPGAALDTTLDHVAGRAVEAARRRARPAVPIIGSSARSSDPKPAKRQPQWRIAWGYNAAHDTQARLAAAVGSEFDGGHIRRTRSPTHPAARVIDRAARRTRIDHAISGAGRYRKHRTALTISRSDLDHG